MGDKQIRRNKIINIATGQPIFTEWIKDVLDQNDFSEVKTAILLWSSDKEGNCARLNIGTEELEYFTNRLQDGLLERKFEDFLARRLGDFIEYV